MCCVCVCVWSERLDFVYLAYICDHTGDMSSSENLCEAQVDERIDAIINTQDPSIVDDLRHHNRGHPTKYEYFWEQCKKYLEDETAADDRRHDEHTHLAKAISVRDLLEQVAERCPNGCPIPSKQWLRLQFWPKNQTNKSALQYTGDKISVELDSIDRNNARDKEIIHDNPVQLLCDDNMIKGKEKKGIFI